MSKVDREILKLSDPEKRQDRARQLALKYFDGATSDADEMMMGDQVRDALLPSVLKSRKSPILQAEAAARGWAETNIFDLGEAYHRSAGSAAAMANTFKKPARIRNPETGEMEDVLLPDVNLSHTLKEIGKRYDEKIQIAREHGGDGALEIELRQERDQMLRNIEILRDGALGRRQTFDSKALQRAGDLAMQFNSWRLMGGSVASSLADPVNIVIANGFADSWHYGVKAAFGNFKAALGKLPPDEEPAVFRHMRLMGAVVERAEAGLDDVRVHDLRHSFASVAAAQKGSLPMIGRLLGHNHTRTTARYAHLAADPVDQLNAGVGEAIADAIGLSGERTSNATGATAKVDM